jgi:predicted MFS family arabinose efflux permease
VFRQIGRNNRLLMLALFIWALGEGLWYTNLRQLHLANLGATEAQIGIALAIEAAVRALLPVPAGYIADRIGSHRVMLASWFIGVVGVVLAALAATWQTFIPGLVIYAMSGFAMPSISLYALQNTSDRGTSGAADRTLTSVFAVYPAGLIISPAIGGVIADQAGIRVCLWIAAAFFSISTMVILFTKAPPVRPGQSALHPRELFQNQAFIKLGLYLALTLCAVFIGYQLLPNYLREVRHYSFSLIGLLFSFMSVGNVILSLLSGRVHPRWNLLAGLGLYWAAVMIIWRGPAPVFTGIGFFLAGSLYVIRTLGLARVSEVVSEQNQGVAFGLVESVQSVALAAAAGIAGQLYGLTPDHALPFIVSLAATGGLALLWFQVRRWLPKSGAVLSIPAMGD